MGDRINIALAALFMAILATLLVVSCSRHEPDSNLFVAASQTDDSVPQFGVFELTLKHNGSYRDKFFDVSVYAVFTSPHGARKTVKGFYYGKDLWKVRFRPGEVGHWTYSYTLTGNNGFNTTGSGSLDCTPSDAEGPMFRDPANAFRWVFANGKPYFPVGIQDCITARGEQLGGAVIDGGESRAEGGRKISLDEYFRIYGNAGFNLLRFSQRNCSYALFDDLDHFREGEAIATDKLLSSARKYGFRVMFGFFGSYGTWTSAQPWLRPLYRYLQLRKEGVLAPGNQAAISTEKRFIDYCIARWGVYVDFWELLNERTASDEWTTLMADYVHVVDPDHKPVGTSWEKPNLPAIDFNAPHWYHSEDESESDLVVQRQALVWKKAGKPVIVGEHGNTGMNWDPLSGVRMRIHLWTGIFEEISFVLWNTSWSKAGMYKGHYTPGAVANIYIGPEERGYVHVLHEFLSHLDVNPHITAVTVSSSSQIRAYGLTSATYAAAYLHSTAGEKTGVDKAEVTVQTPAGTLLGRWIDPATGQALRDVRTEGPRPTLKVPRFQGDVALFLTVQPTEAAARNPHRPF